MKRLESLTKFYSKAALLFIALALVALSCAATEARSVTTQSNYARTLGSVYCVQGRTAVKGWEHDLVKRNPGLEKFHWSPITAARPGTMIFRQRGVSQTTRRYRNSKPNVMSLSEVRLAQQAQAAKAEAAGRRISEADLNGRLRFNRAQEQVQGQVQGQLQGQLVSTYTNASVSQPYAYTYENSYRSKVNGRLISTR